MPTVKQQLEVDICRKMTIPAYCSDLMTATFDARKGDCGEAMVLYIM
jgi:hypothetical protein